MVRYDKEVLKDIMLLLCQFKVSMEFVFGNLQQFMNFCQFQLRPPNPLFIGRNKTRLKTILYWNEFYGGYDTFDFGYGHQAFTEKNPRSVKNYQF